MNPNEIKKNIVSKSDEELIDMMVNREEYTSEALEYSFQELSNRNIDQNFLKETYNNLSINSQEKHRKATTQLTLKEKISILLFPISVPILMISPILLIFFPKLPGLIRFREQGYYKKSSQGILYFVMGIFLWIGIFVLYVELLPYFYNLEK